MANDRPTEAEFDIAARVLQWAYDVSGDWELSLADDMLRIMRHKRNETCLSERETRKEAQDGEGN